MDINQKFAQWIHHNQHKVKMIIEHMRDPKINQKHMLLSEIQQHTQNQKYFIENLIYSCQNELPNGQKVQYLNQILQIELNQHISKNLEKHNQQQRQLKLIELDKAEKKIQQEKLAQDMIKINFDKYTSNFSQASTYDDAMDEIKENDSVFNATPQLLALQKSNLLTSQKAEDITDLYLDSNFHNNSYEPFFDYNNQYIHQINDHANSYM